MNPNGHHPPAGLQVDPAHVIPAPPPAPTAADAQRAYGLPATPPVAQPEPAQLAPQAVAQPQPEPQIVMVQAPRRSPLAWINAKQSRQLGAISAGLLAVAVAFPAYQWLRSDDPAPVESPTAQFVDPQVATLTSEVERLRSELATVVASEPNPLNTLPCPVTNDARRMIGQREDGQLILKNSIRIAELVQQYIRDGVMDLNVFVVRTGMSATQLEVATEGRGVQIFDCGKPAPTTTAPAATPTTVVR